ncbi:hypothetical protein ACODT5_04080 [Streptomyces sp. 5.8]|uniref:hypothetical protein n=1 Tax=Streptomyces sp. 5.8 TaxID=3406571 RepID=UPI003BB717FC
MDIVHRHGEPWIKVSRLGKPEQPEHVMALKAEIERRRDPSTKTTLAYAYAYEQVRGSNASF